MLNTLSLGGRDDTVEQVLDGSVVPNDLSSQILDLGVELSDLLFRPCQLLTQGFELVFDHFLLFIHLGSLFDFALTICVELFDHLVDVLSDEADRLAQRVGALAQRLDAVSHELDLRLSKLTSRSS